MTTSGTARRSLASARMLMAALSAALLTGCTPYARRESPPRLHAALGEMLDSHGEVKLFYATDRRPEAEPDKGPLFTIQRDRMLHLGRAGISIPPNHAAGLLEPVGVSLPATAGNCVCQLSVSQPMTVSLPFWEELRAATELSSERQVFLFVHGFNNSFEDATRRTAQIAHDICFDGPAVTYSWASQGALVDFGVDTANVEWTERYLEKFLGNLLEQSGASVVHILAHSMGTRAVSSVLEALNREGRARTATCRIGQVVLAAADQDAERFARDYAEPMVAACDRLTIYFSNADWALRFGSEKIFGHKRVGSSEPDVEGRGDYVLPPEIDVVDATRVDRGPVGHLYYRASPDFLDDLRGVIAGRDRAERGLIERGRYYEFPDPALNKEKRVPPCDAPSPPSSRPAEENAK